MSIQLMFEIDGRPPAWQMDEAARLESVLDILQRRYDLDIDRPAERRDIRHALDALRPVLAAASDGPRCQWAHADSADPDDVPF
ncbi:hypothetical protein FHP25_33740 [Vineibacter terrae]|uniref:Uncharacterized protein n=1 Tax=Vineibacter terrae TaxID=2586908 RepID=A0A5C8PBI8_9HYPH|nr:hypothetical protein [Vineibacter terrae]TXL70617.1 hypothetical protein FHP25_33740 [Vineibacter terrae]